MNKDHRSTRRKPTRRRPVDRRTHKNARSNHRRYVDQDEFYAERRKEGSVLGKIIPVIIAIVLIIVIVAVYFGNDLVSKFTYSDEKYDMNVYFENSSDSDTAIIMQNSFMPDRAYFFDGVYYVDMDFASKYLNDGFYYDPEENLLLYALPRDEAMVTIGDTKEVFSSSENDLGYTIARVEGDKVLIALDYIKRYSNFEYTAFSDPKRIMLSNAWGERTVATVKKKSAVRHRGGVKSEILKEVAKGDKLTVLEEMETWSKVITDDAIIGYIENKHLDNKITEQEVPVTDYVPEEYTSLVRDHKINMAWHVVASAAGNDTLNSYLEGTKGINVLSPTWFGLSASDGNYTNFSTESYVARAHELGMEVWPTFNNTESGSGVDLKDVFTPTSDRKALVDRLTSDALAVGADGLNIDIELLPVDAAKDFAQFIRELSIACRNNNLVLSIDNYVPMGNTDYYNRKLQGEVADYVVIMGYDEHYASSEEAGSVASIGYVRTGIENTLKEVPPEKVINGIPFYTRIWETKGADVSSKAYSMIQAKEWMSNHNINPEWDDETCQYYGETKEGDVLYQIWMEDIDSIKVKLNVMDTYNIAGVAEWRLDFETHDVWDAIMEYMER